MVTMMRRRSLVLVVAAAASCLTWILVRLGRPLSVTLVAIASSLFIVGTVILRWRRRAENDAVD